MNIREYLKNNILITDGAMGTYFDELYPIETELVEKVLLKNPIRIRKIHEEYLNAGARLIRTNSFAINPNFFEDRGEALDAARVSFNIARQAVDEFHKIKPGEEVYIAADIGTLFDMKSSTDGEDISFYEMFYDTDFVHRTRLLPENVKFIACSDGIAENNDDDSTDKLTNEFIFAYYNNIIWK